MKLLNDIQPIAMLLYAQNIYKNLNKLFCNTVQKRVLNVPVFY